MATRHEYVEIGSCDELEQCIQRLGFLPLLESGIMGYNAEAMMAAECRFTPLPGGGFEWPLWQWKGLAVTDGGCVYGKFFAGKAGFISRDWWPDFFNWRRSTWPAPEAGSVEEAIVATLREQGSMVTRELRRACGFTGPKMRGRFDSYVTRLQMACRIVTEDFVYPRDRHGREYGWGLSLLTTPEALLGREACACPRTPQQSYQRMAAHLAAAIPQATDRQIHRLLK